MQEPAAAPIAIFTRPIEGAYSEILTPEAIRFLTGLSDRFDGRREELLGKRAERWEQLRRGALPSFLPETKNIREGSWTVAPIPQPLLDRRVEITGPVERKMTINALNSGASVFMADFEDSNSPTWDNVLQGQINMRDAVNGSVSFSSPEGKRYKLNPTTAVLMIRPRGWHLVEKHMLVKGKPISGSLFDFGLYFFHNAAVSLQRGGGPRAAGHHAALLQVRHIDGAGPGGDHASVSAGLRAWQRLEAHRVRGGLFPDRSGVAGGRDSDSERNDAALLRKRIWGIRIAGCFRHDPVRTPHQDSV